MELLQIVLIATGLVVTAGGMLMLFRMLRSTDSAIRRPYIPLAVAVVGLVIAYRSLNEYTRLDGQDITIMFLFLLALLSLLGLRFFVADRADTMHESAPQSTQDELDLDPDKEEAGTIR